MYYYNDIIAHRVARENPAQRMEEQQRDLLQRREARSDPEYQTREQHINNMRRQQVRSSRQTSFRALIPRLHYITNRASLVITYRVNITEPCQPSTLPVGGPARFGTEQTEPNKKWGY